MGHFFFKKLQLGNLSRGVINTTGGYISIKVHTKFFILEQFAGNTLVVVGDFTFLVNKKIVLLTQGLKVLKAFLYF